MDAFFHNLTREAMPVGIDIGKGFTFAVVGGFTITKQLKIVGGNNEEIAFVKDASGDVLSAALDITADKKGKDVLFLYRNGDFVDVYGEKLGEVYAKTFRCRKPLLLKMSDGRKFRLRTANIWRGWLLLPLEYTLEGENGVEATYRCNADKSNFRCEIAENSVLPAEVIVTVGALIALKPLHVGDAKDLSRIIKAEDADDVRDARIVWRISFFFGLLMLAAWLLKCLALLFD